MPSSFLRLDITPHSYKARITCEGSRAASDRSRRFRQRRCSLPSRVTRSSRNHSGAPALHEARSSVLAGAGSGKRQTGMPRILALSARLAEMPEPGKATTPTDSASSILSLRLNGAALRCRVQFGLKTTCGTLRLSAQQAAMRSAPRGLPPCSSTMSGCLARTLSSAFQMRA